MDGHNSADECISEGRYKALENVRATLPLSGVAYLPGKRSWLHKNRRGRIATSLMGKGRLHRRDALLRFHDHCDRLIRVHFLSFTHEQLCDKAFLMDLHLHDR